jgi:cytochrome b6-f complex iron-sulfur subunit
VGDSTVSNGVIVARIATDNAAGSFVAVQVACTHEGGTLGYNGNQGLFVCPLHGSIFSKSGSVVQGPATTSLKQYNISVSGSTLSVTA